MLVAKTPQVTILGNNRLNAIDDLLDSLTFGDDFALFELLI
jgi:hypothetical protein